MSLVSMHILNICVFDRFLIKTFSISTSTHYKNKPQLKCKRHESNTTSTDPEKKAERKFFVPKQTEKRISPP